MPARPIRACCPVAGCSARRPHLAALAQADHPEARGFRRGFFLGDGTGCGKGRQIAGDHRRQHGPGPPARPVAVQERRPAGGRSARLVRDRRRDPRHHPASGLEAGRRHSAGQGRPLFDLRHAAPAGPGRARLATGPDRRLAGRGLRRGDRLRRGPRHGQRGRRRQRRARSQEGLAARHGGSGPAEPAAQRPGPLCLGDRRDHAGKPGLRRAAGPVGRAGGAVPTREAFHRRGRGRRRGGDGADRARAEGHGALHRPLAVVRRRRVRGPAPSPGRTRHRASGTPGPTPTS
jgi:hypothetical protein